eukprot:GEMP01012059.1.p1 GENE.GEMP01012059.1~~GEMP01012059.1.p1  ORF type:complete len:928 (+),score=264.09 GEMP01012059.1:390-3173(+)
MTLDDLRREVEMHDDLLFDGNDPLRESLQSTIASVEALMVKSKESLAIAEAELQTAHEVEKHERIECKNVMRVVHEKNNRLLKVQRAEKEAEQARVYAMQIKQLQREERINPKSPVSSKTKKERVEQQSLIKEMEDLETRRQTLINCITELKAAGVNLVENRDVLLSTSRLSPFQARIVADQVEMKDQRDNLLRAVEQDEAKIRQIREAEQYSLSSLQSTETARNDAFQEFETQRNDLEDKLETLQKYSSATKEKYWEGNLDAEMHRHVREGVTEGLRALSIEWTTKLCVFEASIADLRNDILRMTQTKLTTSPPLTPASSSTALPASAVRSSSAPLSRAARLSTRKAAGARLSAGAAGFSPTPSSTASDAYQPRGAELGTASPHSRIVPPLAPHSFFAPQTRVSDRCVAEMDDDALTALALRVEQLALLERRAAEYREYFAAKQKALTDWLDDLGVIEQQSPASALPPWLGEAADMDCCYRKSLELARKAFADRDKQLADDVLEHRNEARRIHLELEEEERLKKEKQVELEEFLKSEQRRQNCGALNPPWMRKQDQHTVWKLYTEERNVNEEHWKLIAELEKIEERRLSLSARCREYGLANPVVDADRIKEDSRRKSLQRETDLHDTLEILRRLKEDDKGSNNTATQDDKESRSTYGSRISALHDESQKARHAAHVKKARLSEASTTASRKSEEVAERQSALYALETRLEEYHNQLLGKKPAKSPKQSPGRKPPGASKHEAVVDKNTGMDDTTPDLPTLVEVRRYVDDEGCRLYSNIVALLRGIQCDIEKYGSSRTPQHSGRTSSHNGGAVGTSRVLYLTKDLGRLHIMRAGSTASRVSLGFVKVTRLKAVHVSQAVMNALVARADDGTATPADCGLVMELQLVEGDSWRILVADAGGFHVLLRALETLIGTDKTRLQSVSCSLQL